MHEEDHTPNQGIRYSFKEHFHGSYSPQWTPP
jgi:hypothetical protein